MRPGSVPASAASCSRVRPIRSVPVPHRFGGLLEVALERLGDVRVAERMLGDRLAHVEQPAVSLCRADREREMAHPQTRMAALRS